MCGERSRSPGGLIVPLCCAAAHFVAQLQLWRIKPLVALGSLGRVVCFSLAGPVCITRCNGHFALSNFQPLSTSIWCAKWNTIACEKKNEGSSH